MLSNLSKLSNPVLQSTIVGPIVPSAKFKHLLNCIAWADPFPSFVHLVVVCLAFVVLSCGCGEIKWVCRTKAIILYGPRRKRRSVSEHRWLSLEVSEIGDGMEWLVLREARGWYASSSNGPSSSKLRGPGLIVWGAICHTKEGLSTSQIKVCIFYTLVFFIVHLSHTFQTLLCFLSITTGLCPCEELDPLELLFTGLDGLESFLDW